MPPRCTACRISLLRVSSDLSVDEKEQRLKSQLVASRWTKHRYEKSRWSTRSWITKNRQAKLAHDDKIEARVQRSRRVVEVAGGRGP